MDDSQTASVEEHGDCWKKSLEKHGNEWKTFIDRYDLGDELLKIVCEDYGAPRARPTSDTSRTTTSPRYRRR